MNENENDCPRCALGDGSACVPTFASISGMVCCVGETGPFVTTTDYNKLRAKYTKLDNFVAWMRGRTHELDRYNTHTTLSMFLRKLDELPNSKDQP